MKYAIIKVVNGNYFIHSEGWTDLEKAKINYADAWKTLLNASDVKTAEIAIFDENLAVMGYKELVSHGEN